MARIRMTQRRYRLIQARERAIDKIKVKIRPVFRRQFRRLESFLRSRNRGGDLRNRIKKSSDNIGDFFAKANTSNQQEWDNWKKTLIAALILALLGAVSDFGDEENAVWESRGYDQVDFQPKQIVDAMRARVGEIYFSGLADTTFAGIQSIISDWYSTDESIGDLTDRLDKYFNDSRIDTIADSSACALMSQVVFQEMTMHHWQEWVWVHYGADVPCNDCQDHIGNVYRIGDEMPPLHPNCHCGPEPVLAST